MSKKPETRTRAQMLQMGQTPAPAPVEAPPPADTPVEETTRADEPEA